MALHRSKNCQQNVRRCNKTDMWIPTEELTNGSHGKVLEGGLIGYAYPECLLHSLTSQEIFSVWKFSKKNCGNGRWRSPCYWSMESWILKGLWRTRNIENYYRKRDSVAEVARSCFLRDDLSNIGHGRDQVILWPRLDQRCAHRHCLCVRVRKMSTRSGPMWPICDLGDQNVTSFLTVSPGWAWKIQEIRLMFLSIYVTSEVISCNTINSLDHLSQNFALRWWRTDLIWA